jgi:HK97 family phage portal protein
MGVIARLLGRERRSQTVGTADPYLGEFLGRRDGIGGFVDPGRASGLSVAQAAITCIAQNLASMPLHLYERQADGGRARAAAHPLYDVLHDMAADGMTAFEAREALVASLLTRGNAFALIEWNGRGQVTALRPLDPITVGVERLRSGRLRYRVTDHRGGVTVHLQEEVLHLRYRLAAGGVMGVSPIELARETFGLALTQQDQAGKQAGRAFRPEGVLSFPNQIAGTGKADAIRQIGERAEAMGASGGVLVLDGGAVWSPMALTAKDAEFLKSRKLSDLAVARIFGVPPTAIGITDNATYSNVDGESRALVMRCLAPMARRLEQAMNAALLPEAARRRMFVEHDLAGLLRGDLKARYEAYRIGRQAGFLSANEIRGWENMPRIDGGDEYLSPLNMAVAGQREDEDGGDGQS